MTTLFIVSAACQLRFWAACPLAEGLAAAGTSDRGQDHVAINTQGDVGARGCEWHFIHANSPRGCVKGLRWPGGRSLSRSYVGLTSIADTQHLSSTRVV